jgi:ABC-type uncharacterized transport system fused permease/ATPase subunit
VLSLSLGLLTSVVSLVSFPVILWGLSGPAEIPLGKWGTVHIPAYLVWTALFYAGVGTWLTAKIGRPLVPLNVARQRFEADFRFSLVRFRENAESIALYGGEPVELRVFNETIRYQAVDPHTADEPHRVVRKNMIGIAVNWISVKQTPLFSSEMFVVCRCRKGWNRGATGPSLSQSGNEQAAQ